MDLCNYVKSFVMYFMLLICYMFSMGFHALKVQETILVSVASRAGPSLSWVELQKRRSRRMGHYSIAEPGPTAEVHGRTIAEGQEQEGP